ncbi:alpha/beta fold hydrolase [Candidatus Nomurabacteria bacterium]|nr:alpha/beta fold hydrolase [Candidatus Nomurabacteria bacterium]
MKTAIIIHGYTNKSEFLDTSRPAASNDHWFPWIQRQLLLNGIEAQTPEMPGFYEPNYEKWKNLLDKFEPDENTMLVGHSCGGGFLVRWLSENNKKVGRVVLVAPWLDPNKKIDPDFFNFEINPDIVSRTDGITIMYSTDDNPTILQSVEMIKSKVKNIKIKEFNGKGHFILSRMKTEKFPELLSLLID